MVFNVAEHGFAIIPGVFGRDEARSIAARLGPVSGAGLRCPLGIDGVSEIVASSRVLQLVRPWLGGEPVAVRVICFDKSPGKNWLVPWHQDLTIAVQERREVPGFGPWSVKDGIPHVQPPAELLERMLTVRLHLDDAHAGNGALKVIPGSHRGGRLSPDEVRAAVASTPEHICEVEAGGILLMRPLILHASSRSVSDTHRRVLHVEYAGFTLPSGLEWATS